MITIRGWEEIEHRFPGTTVLDITPASYDQFEAYASREPGLIRVDVISDVPLPDEIAVPKGLHYLTPVQFAFDAGERCFGLLPGGGFLPPELLMRGTGLLIDRNIVDAIRRGAERRSPAASDVLWLNSDKFKVSPVVAAFEGKQRRVQSKDEFLDELKSVGELIDVHLPRAYKFNFGEPAASTVYELLEQCAERLSKEKSFLRGALVLLKDPPPADRLAAIEFQLLELARRHELKAMTAVVWSALAVLYESEDSRRVRKMLKVGPAWLDDQAWEGHAYNVLADVRLLELMSMMVPLEHRFAGLTKDKSLAYAWCVLRPSSERSGDFNWMRCFPVVGLLPRLVGIIADLRSRMMNSGSKCEQDRCQATA